MQSVKYNDSGGRNVFDVGLEDQLVVRWFAFQVIAVLFVKPIRILQKGQCCRHDAMRTSGTTSVKCCW